jgi:hypothetical protein
VSWTEQPSRLADTYTLQEALDVIFTSGLRNVCTTAQQSCQLTDNPAGTYYYRVRGCNKWGCGEWSYDESATVFVQPVPSGNVNITHIHADGFSSHEPDEYVEIRNDDSRPIQLSSWTLRNEANHVFTFPSHVMQPGEVCRVYTDEYHSAWCGFSYGSRHAIWNNGGDCGYLRDSAGAPIDVYCY